MIRQIIREKQRVMTGLMCDVDGVGVTYTRLVDRFVYHMSVCNDTPYEDALKAVEQLVGVMEDQSYDHGAQWRCVSIKSLPKDDQYDLDHKFEVQFRIRDSW